MVKCPESVFEKVKAANQEHLLKFWDELSPEHQDQLAAQLNSLDFGRLKQIFESTMARTSIQFLMQDYSKPKVDAHAKVQPISAEHYGSYKASSQETLDKYWNTGLKAIAARQVAVIVLAGGQATRLGASEPKGTISLQLHRGAPDSLLFLQAAQIAKLQSLAKDHCPDSTPVIQWYIMTSAATSEATQKHINDVVLPATGLQSHQVHFFSQSEMPCFLPDGNLMLADKNRVATSPDGNGGLYPALRPLLPQMHQSGIMYVHVYCVDNVLCRVADPNFVGFCVESGADCAAKVVTKTNPNEAVGVVCQVNRVPKVVEYSEISEDLANQRDANEPDKLAYRAGNIANHFFTVDFLNGVCPSPLPFHPAHKKIPFCDEQGNLIKPKTPNGIKMEQFVFDVFKDSKRFYVWEVDRCDEFSPLKNADSAGVDCMTTCRRDLWTLHTKWIQQNRGTVNNAVMEANGDTANQNAALPVEIDAKLSYAGEGLKALVDGKSFTPPFYLK